MRRLVLPLLIASVAVGCGTDASPEDADGVRRVVAELRGVT